MFCFTPQCSNCESSSARSWCLDCNEALCDDCVSAHRRVSLTRWHRLQNQASGGEVTSCQFQMQFLLPEGFIYFVPGLFCSSDSGSISPKKFCKVHPSESLKLFCVTCMQLTCRDCQLESHKNHRYRRDAAVRKFSECWILTATRLVRSPLRFKFVSGAMEGVQLLVKKQLDAYLQLLRDKMEAAAKNLQDMETRYAESTWETPELHHRHQNIFHVK